MAPAFAIGRMSSALVWWTTPSTAKSHSDFELGDLLLDVDLLGVLGRRNLVRHVDDGGDAAAHRRGRAGGEVFLVRHAGIAEVHVRVDQAGQNMLPADVDDLLAVGQRVVGADRDDLAVGDGDAALKRCLRRDDLAVLYDQICLHDFLLTVFLERSAVRRPRDQ